MNTDLSDVRVFCRNVNLYKDYPVGITLSEILADLSVKSRYPIVAALVNNRLESLNFAVFKPKTIEFVDISCAFGMRVYVYSLVMTLSRAVADLFPGARFRIEHPISKGYFCHILFPDKHAPSPQEIQLIKSKLHELTSLNLPIEKHEAETPKVIELLRRSGAETQARLLESLSDPYASYYRLGSHVDYYNGILVPSTGFLDLFDLFPYSDGVFLQVPDRSRPVMLEQFAEQPKMFEIFGEQIHWCSLTGISNLSDINRLSGVKDHFSILIKVFEALHEKKISRIADEIVARPQVKIILIAGPSSSGKTTFSKRLSIQLMANGILPFNLSTDNYFVDRADTPLDADGNPDFETIKAMDLPLFNTQLRDLLAGREVTLSEYDFKEGRKHFTRKMTLRDKSVLIIEGIHALNPELTASIPDEVKYKVYVSALTPISLDEHNWIATTDTRLLRRILRDSKYRNYPARKTIAQWPSVRRGEEKWIFPYQENADVMFNSALLFEFSVLRRHVEPILREVPRSCPEYAEAYRLLRLLRYITPIPDYEVPRTSLLREFMGGSNFRY